MLTAASGIGAPPSEWTSVPAIPPEPARVIARRNGMKMNPSAVVGQEAAPDVEVDHDVLAVLVDRHGLLDQAEERRGVALGLPVDRRVTAVRVGHARARRIEGHPDGAVLARGTSASPSRAVAPFWRSSRLKARSGRATVIHPGGPWEVSAWGESPISEMWMSTRAMRSKGKGASVRKTDVFPSRPGPAGPDLRAGTGREPQGAGHRQCKSRAVHRRLSGSRKSSAHDP